MASRIQSLSLFYSRKFDLQVDNEQYQSKFDFYSSHSVALKAVKADERLLILGCGSAALVAPFAKKGCRLSVVDRYISLELEALSEHCAEMNLNEFDFRDLPDSPPYDTVLALDIIEHLASPESFLEGLRETLCLRGSRLILTTPNVTYLPLRIMFLFGFFNYGKRGILDRTHTRLFTFDSMRRLLQQAGFDAISMQGIPAPFPLAFGRKSWIGKALLHINQIMATIWPGAFSYQIYCEATPSPTVDELLERTIKHSLETVPSQENVRC